MIEVALNEVVAEVRRAEDRGYNQALDDIRKLFGAASGARENTPPEQAISLIMAGEMVKAMTRR